MDEEESLSWDGLLRNWIGRELRDRELIDEVISLAAEKWQPDSPLVGLLEKIREDPYQRVEGFAHSDEGWTDSERRTLRICLRLREVLASDVIINASESDRPILCQVVERATVDFLDTARKLDDKLLMAVALRLSVNAHYYRQDFGQAFNNALQAARLYRDLLLERRPPEELVVSGFAFCLDRCGNCLAGEQRFSSALRFQRLALKLYQKLESQSQSTFSRDVAMAKHNLVNSLIDLNRFKEANILAAEVVIAYRALTSKERELFLPHLAHSLINQSKTFRLQGDSEPSIHCSKEAVHLFLELTAELPEIFGSDLAAAYHELSLCLKNSGQIKAARRLARMACKCYAQQKIGEGMNLNRDVAHAFQQWAICLTASGHFEKAAQVFDQTVSFYDTLHYNGDLSVCEGLARCLNEQSVLLFERGQLEDSIHPAQRSYQLFRELGKDSLLDLAISTANLAGRHFRLGRTDKALKFARESLKYYRQTGLGNDDLKLRYSGALMNFATYLSSANNPARTLPPMTRAVAIAKEVSARTPDVGLLELARILTNYTTRLRENNRIEESIKVGQEAIAVFRILTEREHERFCPSLAAALNNLATSLIEAQRVEEGLEALEEGVALFEELSQNYLYQDLFLEDRFQLVYNKALCLLRSGPDGYENALKALRAAQKCSVKLRLQFRSLSQRKRIQQSVLSSRHWHLLVCTAGWFKSRQAVYLEEAFEIAEQIRGRGLDDLLSAELVSPASSDGLEKLVSQYFRVERQLGEIESMLANRPSFSEMTTGLTQDSHSEVRLGLPNSEEQPVARFGSPEQVAERKKELNSLKEQIREIVPDWSPREISHLVTASQVARSLPPRSAFLQLTFVKNGMLALILRPSGEITCVNTPGLDLEALQNFGNQWQSNVSELAQRLSEPEREKAREKFRTLIAKVTGFLPQTLREALLAIRTEVDHLVICPNGPLHLFPLHLCEVGVELTLGDTFQVSYIPSGSAYCHATDQAKDSRVEQVLLAAGASDDLLFGQLEARVLKRLFADDATKLSSSPAPEGRDEALAESGVFSFSGHSYFDRVNPIRSGIRLQTGSLTIGHFLEKPRLSRCHIAILNGCESGFLQPDATDDFVSLPSALLYSGAKAVVSTLWSVSDLSACFFGIRFHESLKEGCSPQDAFHASVNWLRGQGEISLKSKGNFLGEVLPHYLEHSVSSDFAVQITERAEWLLRHIPNELPPFSDPLHWAPFILQGDASRPLEWS